jgi:acetyltransferase-like isoleucine patch superfamily enzyme
MEGGLKCMKSLFIRLYKSIPTGYKRILTCFFCLIPFINDIRKRGNQVIIYGILFKCKISIAGKNNKVFIDDHCIIKHTSFHINGDNNIIYIGPYCMIINGDFCTEDDGNAILIGEHTSICGRTHLACIEGKTISIGKECLFSSDIMIRTGDSHSILDMNGKRINPSENVTLADHIWVCNRAIILKGALINHDSIVATSAVVTKVFEEPNAILAGVPAKIVQHKIQWGKSRI